MAIINATNSQPEGSLGSEDQVEEASGGRACLKSYQCVVTTKSVALFDAIERVQVVKKDEG